MTETAHKPSSGDLFPCLDGVRGLAVLSVVVYHIIYLNPENPFFKVLQSFIRAGWMGVPIFFVLSGFLISYSVFKASDSFDPVAYAARRTAKIAPPFFLSIIVFAFLAYFWKKPTDLITSTIASASTLTHFPGGGALLNPVYWSLNIEIHFYIVFPLVYFSVKRISKRPDWWTLWVFLMIPPLVRFSSRLPESGPIELWALHANLFPRALDNFALGILFSILFMRFRHSDKLQRLAPAMASSGALLLAVTYCLYAFFQWKYSIHNAKNVLVFEVFRYLPALATFGLLFCVFLPPSHLLYRILSSSVLGFLGLVSYEWFLFHYPPAQWLRDLTGNAHGSIGAYLLRTGLPFVGTFLISILIYFFFSAPIISWTKRWLKNRISLANR